MPFKDPEKRKAYQAELMRKRRGTNTRTNTSVIPKGDARERRKTGKQSMSGLTEGITGTNTPVIPWFQAGIQYREDHADFTLMILNDKNGKWRPLRSLKQREPIKELGGLIIWKV